MRAPHRIKRQVLEIRADDPGEARRLQSVLEQLQRRRIAPLLERLCDELGAGDRLVRIDRLTIDVGEVDVADFEGAFMGALTRQLRTGLVQAIRDEEERSDDAPTSAPLEALAVFARTGTLPWWSPTRSPTLLHEHLRELVRAEPQRLTALVRALAGEPRALARIVAHFDDASLAALVELLHRPHALRSLAGDGGAATVFAELHAIAATSAAMAALPASKRRGLLWRGLLAASLRAEARPESLYAAALAEAAGLAGIDGAALRTALERHAREAPGLDAWLSAAARALVGGEALPRLLDGLRTLAAGRPTPADPAAWLRAHVARLVGGAADEGLVARARAELAGEVAAGLAGPMRAALAAGLRAGAPTSDDVQPTSRDAPSERAAEVARSSVSSESSRPHASNERTEAPSSESRSARTAESGSTDISTNAASGPAVHRADGRDDASTAGRSTAEIHHTPMSATAVLASLRSAIAPSDATTARADAEHHALFKKIIGALGEPGGQDLASALADALRRGALARGELEQARRALERPSATLPAAQRALTAAIDAVLASPGEPAGARPSNRGPRVRSPRERLPLDLGFSAAEEIHIDDAGLVLLWPFFGHFFGYLGLVEGKGFRDEVAQHRAAGLLRAVASGEPEFAEYQLPLARVLCGVAIDAVLDPGPPLRDDEAEECARLLAAVIGRAKILGEMSVGGFRGTFLMREGILSPRDGAWLLRVERRSYDLVLGRFPWGFDWVKLPWMDAAIRVEW